VSGKDAPTYENCDLVLSLVSFRRHGRSRGLAERASALAGPRWQAQINRDRAIFEVRLFPL
jgi:hypothetical protein